MSPRPLGALLVLAVVLALGPGALAQQPPASPEDPPDAHRRDDGGAGGGQAGATIDAALGWLARHQAPDGRWSAAGWRERCGEGCRGEGVTSEVGDPSYDEGLTALALLAFLGRGAGPEDARHGATVRRGLGWLVGRQQDDGSLGFSGRTGQAMYNHAVATQALAAAAHLGVQDARGALERAVAFALAAQNPDLGWKYGVRSGRNDTSLTAWMTLALRRAEHAGVAVPEEAYGGARAWLVRATDAAGDAGYETPGGGSCSLPPNDGKFDPTPAMTAAALCARRAIGDGPRVAELAQGTALLVARPPEWAPRRRNFYYWLWGARALRQVGGEAWTRWRAALHQALLPNQRTTGCAAGSWDPTDEWSLAGGRVYATATLALALEADDDLPTWPERDLSPAGIAQQRAARAAAAERERAEQATEAALRAEPLGDPGASLRDRQRALATVVRALEGDAPALRGVALAMVTALPDDRLALVLEDVRDGPRHVTKDGLRLLAALPGRAGCLAALTRALGDADASVRVAAANVLGAWGPAASDAARALEQTATRDAEWAVRKAAERALARVRGS